MIARRTQLRSMVDQDLWRACQRIAYPTRPTSHWPPFQQSDKQGPNRQPASWLYWTLASNRRLRAKVLP